MTENSLNLVKQLYESYISALSQHEKGILYWKPIEWTRFVKEAWASIGVQEGFTCFYSQSPQRTSI
jgi:hypothetical protein